MALSVIRKKAFTSSKDGSDATFQPMPKRICGNKTKTNSNEQNNYVTTIFDLNLDCLRELFDYVSVRDLVRSQRVSKQWRFIVNNYLQDTHWQLIVSSIPYQYDKFKPADPNVKCRILSIQHEEYRKVVKLLGNSIMAADCIDQDMLWLLGHCCPNLEDLRIIPQTRSIMFFSCKPVFKNLMRISFKKVDCDTLDIQFTDMTIDDLLKPPSLEKLEILACNTTLSGQCLHRLNKNLKSLRLENCKDLSNEHLVRATDRLTKLTELKLSNNQVRNCNMIHKMIANKPELVCLGWELFEYDSTTKIDRLINAICDLRNLRHLSVYGNANVTDELLNAVGHRCRELRTVSIGACFEVTAAGVVALCKGAWKTLTALDVSLNEDITDADVALCVNSCPRLEMLDVQICPRVTDALPPRAAEAARTRPLPPPSCLCLRPGPLRLHLSSWLRIHVSYPESNLILDFSGDNHKCENYIEKKCSCRQNY